MTNTAAKSELTNEPLNLNKGSPSTKRNPCTLLSTLQEGPAALRSASGAPGAALLLVGLVRAA